MVRTVAAASLVFLLFVAVPPAGAGDARFCVPEREVRRSLERFEALLRECGRRADCWEQGRAMLEEALADYPEDPHLHRAYQDLFKRWPPRDKAVTAPDLDTWYRRLLEDDPDNPVYLYAYGRWVDDPAAARALHQRAVDADPDFPWGHVGLAYMAASRGEAGDGEASEILMEHLGRFIELCPSRSKVALSYADNVDDPQFWRRHLPRLRAALKEEPIAGTYVHYAQVWHLELASLPASEQTQVQKRIAADLKRIMVLGLWDNEAWRATVVGGYRLIGDDEAAARIEERIRRRRSER